MKAGKSNYEVGAKIKITRVTDEDDKDLIGLTGTLTHPFGCYLCNLGKTDRFEVMSE